MDTIRAEIPTRRAVLSLTASAGRSSCPVWALTRIRRNSGIAQVLRSNTCIACWNSKRDARDPVPHRLCGVGARDLPVEGMAEPAQIIQTWTRNMIQMKWKPHRSRRSRLASFRIRRLSRTTRGWTMRKPSGSKSRRKRRSGPGAAAVPIPAQNKWPEGGDPAMATAASKMSSAYWRRRQSGRLSSRCRRMRN